MPIVADSPTLPVLLAKNLETVRSRIERACERSGRDPAGVRILAVTKYVGPEVVRELARIGLAEVGENHVQAALAKMGQVREPVRWHLIGHLQDNKVKKVPGRFASVQTVDSPRLAARLGQAAAESALVLPVWVQVNTSREPTKSGAAPEAVSALIEAVRREPALDLAGLFTLGPLGAAEDARPCFRLLRELGSRHGLARLSMGMSQDLEVAVEEGATDVRVGSALYQGIEPAEPA